MLTSCPVFVSSEYPGGIDIALGKGLPFLDNCGAFELLCALRCCPLWGRLYSPDPLPRDWSPE